MSERMEVLLALLGVGVLSEFAIAFSDGSRKRRIAVTLVALTFGLASLAYVSTAGAAIAKMPEKSSLIRKVRSAPIGSKWEPVVRLYSGSNYGVGYLNSLWQGCPKGPRRGVMLSEAIAYRIPWRLLLAVYGAESSYGRASSYFGLTGYFPGSGTSGSFRRDAHLAARLWSKLYRGRYGRSAL